MRRRPHQRWRSWNHRSRRRDRAGSRGPLTRPRDRGKPAGCPFAGRVATQSRRHDRKRVRPRLRSCAAAPAFRPGHRLSARHARSHTSRRARGGGVRARHGAHRQTHRRVLSRGLRRGGTRDARGRAHSGLCVSRACRVSDGCDEPLLALSQPLAGYVVRAQRAPLARIVRRQPLAPSGGGRVASSRAPHSGRDIACCHDRGRRRTCGVRDWLPRRDQDSRPGRSCTRATWAGSSSRSPTRRRCVRRGTGSRSA